jgi:hypothetical protein
MPQPLVSFIENVIESILKLLDWKVCRVVAEFSHAPRFLPPRLRLFLLSASQHSPRDHYSFGNVAVQSKSGYILCFIDYLSVCVIRHISLLVFSPFFIIYNSHLLRERLLSSPHRRSIPLARSALKNPFRRGSLSLAPNWIPKCSLPCHGMPNIGFSIHSRVPRVCLYHFLGIFFRLSEFERRNWRSFAPELSEGRKGSARAVERRHRVDNLKSCSRTWLT